MNQILREKRVRSYVLMVYKLLLAMIIIAPLFGKFVSNTTILRFTELFCWFGAIFYAFRICRLKAYARYGGYTKFLYVLLAIISAGIVARADFPASVKDWALFLIRGSGLPVYVAPIILLMLPNRQYFRDIVRLFFKASLFVLPIWVLNASDLVQDGYKGEGIGVLLPFFSAFLLALSGLFSKKERMLTLFIWGMYLLLMLLNARRNVTFTLVLYGIFSYLMTLLDDWKRHPAKVFMIITGSVLGLLLLQLNMDNLTSGVFNRMSNRATEDTRSGVEELFFVDFASSPAEDWIFGRGMDGGYYQIMKNEDTGEVSDNRKGIETGYLHFVLKGGLVYAVCIVLIILNAIGRARRDKDVVVSRYFIMVMLSYLIDLYTTAPICSYMPRTVIFWFVISVMTQRKGERYAVSLEKI